MEDSIPRNTAGQLVSIADKLDTLTGCFRVGLIPTGSRDPFALRRAAQGIVKTVVEGRLRLPIRKWLGDDTALVEFFLDRVRFYFREIRGFRYDEVNAALASGWDDLVDVEERAGGGAGGAAHRRTSNRWPPVSSAFAIFCCRPGSPAAERSIRRCWKPGRNRSSVTPFQRVRAVYPGERGTYRPALETIASMRPQVDLFFDKVLVNAPDQLDSPEPAHPAPHVAGGVFDHR